MEETKNRIITIGRQYGSGGREIGRRVAKRLGIAFYDKELLDLAAEKSGIHPDVIRQAEEQPTNSLLYSLVVGTANIKGAATGPLNVPLTDQVFFAQADIIRSLAEKGDCVMIGRCADYVLREYPGCLSVFIHADMQTKVQRCLKYYGIDEATARERIRKIDKRRANYYNYFTDKTWGNTNSYDMSLDCGRFGVDGCAELIAQAAREDLRFREE